MTDGGNIQQRVFDAFPPYPQGITLFEIYDKLPFFRPSIRDALSRLYELGKVEAVPGTLYHHRLKLDATRPTDRRVGNKNALRSRRRKP